MCILVRTSIKNAWPKPVLRVQLSNGNTGIRESIFIKI